MEEEDAVVHFSLEDEITSPPKKSVFKKSTKPEPIFPDNNSTLLDDVEILDAELVTRATGIFHVEWPLLGMDCPDCASKATRALSYLPQALEPVVSATSGEVRLAVDVEKGSMAEIGKVLKSLGHAADSPWQEITNATAEKIATRNNVQIHRVEKLLKTIPGVIEVEVEKDGPIMIQLPSKDTPELQKLRVDKIREIIGAEPKFAVGESTRIRPDQWRLIGAGLAFPLLILIVVFHEIAISEFWIATIALPGVILGGFEMFKEAWGSIKAKQLGFQVLTSLAVIGATIQGMWHEALLVVIFVAFTQHLEGDALIKAREAMQGGLDRLPKTARLVRRGIDVSEIKATAISIAPMGLSPGFGGMNLSMAPATTSLAPTSQTNSSHNHSHDSNGREEIPIELLNSGDIIEVRSGELIPADGIITEGEGSLDMAPLTGESVPVSVSKGDELNAGLVLARGPLNLKVTAIGDDTKLSGLIDAVHTFRETPPRVQGAIETFTAWWVPIVILGAFGVWQLVDPTDWKIVLLLWVVACPCALLLAAPVPNAAALSKAAQRGAIVRGGDVIERLAKVNHVLLDKTGTLTTGRPKIGEISISGSSKEETILAMALGLELKSNHPYALSLQDLCEEKGLKPSSITNLKDVNAGIEGKFKDQYVAIMRPDVALEKVGKFPAKLQSTVDEANKLGHGASIMIKGEKAIAAFTFIHDDARDGSDTIVKEFYDRQINVEILSGDTQSAVDAFAFEAGLTDGAAHGGLSPEEKVAFTQKRSVANITMMVGDGFNDSAALAVADVGVAVGSGESVNLEAADVLIPGDNPAILLDLIDTSRKARGILMANLYFSLGVTITLVYAVLNGWYSNIWFGVVVHELSVVVVILNGARIAGKSGWVDLLVGTVKSVVYDTIEAFRLLNTKYNPRAKSVN